MVYDVKKGVMLAHNLKDEKTGKFKKPIKGFHHLQMDGIYQKNMMVIEQFGMEKILNLEMIKF